MPPRDDLFKKFGPKLIEALFIVLLDEINNLRPGLGKPTITMQDLINSALNHVTNIPNYDWMYQDPEG